MKILSLSTAAAVFSALFSSAVTPLAAQTTPARPPTSGTGSSLPPTSNRPPMGSPSGSSSPASSMDATRVIMVTGKVVLENGQEPGQPIQIERICTGHPHPEGYSDPRGNFSVRLGQEQEIPDASETADRSTVTASNPAGGTLAQADRRG